jgi:hypothetical protein
VELNTAIWALLGSAPPQAIYDNQLVDIHFTQAFYKTLLGRKLTFHDMEVSRSFALGLHLVCTWFGASMG